MSATSPSDALAESDSPTESEAPAPANPTRFAGDERAFWRLLIRGAVLLLVTLGIYRFWLVTDVRRALWNNSQIAGDYLEYIGTARELLLGFLIAVVLLVPVNAVFFLATLTGGRIAQIAGTVAFAALAALGQFAVYRARRYRLSRTVYRGIRFHQTGSAIRYAVCAIFWWAMIVLTLGLAYPFAQASLERFKLHNTWLGDLQGQFTGSGFRLFFRGILLWIVVMVPLLLGIFVAATAIDWDVVAEAMRRSGADTMGRIEAANLGPALAVATLSVGWSVLAAALLYPVFQAMVLRWWISGLRFGELTITSRLATGAVYAVYARFMWIALLVAVVLGTGAAVIVFVARALEGWLGSGGSALGIAALVAGYAIVALAYSTIYQATVRWRLWRHGVESLELSGTEVLDRVRASGASGSPVGEGLADALNVGGI
jgi:uncharacterized membrane protein YjgN (DUF898 family)